jgi:hypothetical protein
MSDPDSGTPASPTRNRGHLLAETFADPNVRSLGGRPWRLTLGVATAIIGPRRPGAESSVVIPRKCRLRGL